MARYKQENYRFLELIIGTSGIGEKHNWLYIKMIFSVPGFQILHSSCSGFQLPFTDIDAHFYRFCLCHIQFLCTYCVCRRSSVKFWGASFSAKKIEAFSQACLKHSREKELNVIWLRKFAFHLKPHAQKFRGLIPPCLDIVLAWLPEIVECGAWKYHRDTKAHFWKEG